MPHVMFSAWFCLISILWGGFLPNALAVTTKICFFMMMHVRFGAFNLHDLDFFFWRSFSLLGSAHCATRALMTTTGCQQIWSTTPLRVTQMGWARSGKVWLHREPLSRAVGNTEPLLLSHVCIYQIPPLLIVTHMVVVLARKRLHICTSKIFFSWFLGPCCGQKLFFGVPNNPYF